MNTPIILAVASGKGGVGKTLTAVNIAISAARSGIRAAVVDADPLSNIMAMLDYTVPNTVLPDKLTDPKRETYSVAPRFEVIFPQRKETHQKAAQLTASLLSDHRDWLMNRYGMILVDMPAGVGTEEPFPYLKSVDALLLVTNPEPTAHVAAGIFLKSVQPIFGGRPIFLWHNRYESNLEGEFDPNDVIGNYNRNMSKAEKIPPYTLNPVAFVPPDPSLDLAKADPPVLIDLHRALSTTLNGLRDMTIPPLPRIGEEGFRSATLVAYILRQSTIETSTETALKNIETFFKKENASASIHQLPEEIRIKLTKWFQKTVESPLRRQIEKTWKVVNLHIEELETSEKSLGISVRIMSKTAVNREMIPLLKTLSCLPRHDPMRRLASFLLFRFAILKLFSNESALKLISVFLPRRLEGGVSVRDRRKQIARLIGTDTVYQKRYFGFIKKLYPVFSRQLDHLAVTFDLHDLLFRNADGVIARSAYVQLFSETLYEIINSGLGVVAGFRFRPSSRSFNKGYETLLSYLE